MNSKAVRCCTLFFSEFLKACAEREIEKSGAEDLCCQALLRPFSLCTGYPLAGCSPAEPASVSPDEL